MMTTYTKIQEGSRYPAIIDSIGEMYSGYSFAHFRDRISEFKQFLWNDIYQSIITIQVELGIDISLSGYPTFRDWVRAFNEQHYNGTDTVPLPYPQGVHRKTTLVDTTTGPTEAVLIITQEGAGTAFAASVTIGGGDIVDGYAGSNLKFNIDSDGLLSSDVLPIWSFKEKPIKPPGSLDGFTGTATFTVSLTPIVSGSEQVYVNGILQEVSVGIWTSGIVLTATTNTLTQDTGAGGSWTSNNYAGSAIVITTSGKEQVHKIDHNTGTVYLQAGDTWMPTITVGDTFMICNDYAIDYNTGLITFYPGSIPSVDSNIRVTYQYTKALT